MRRIDLTLSAPDSVAALRRIQDKYMPEAERRRHAAELEGLCCTKSLKPAATLTE